MPAYDAIGFRPPAPVARVTIRSPDSGAIVSEVSMLLDSGADVSLLPREPLAGILESVESFPKYELEAFDGAKSSAPAVQLELQFLGKKFRGQFLIVEGEYGILGRNILNSLAILFNGPNLTWSEAS